MWVITAFLAVNGVVIAEATYRRSLPYNRSQAELSGLLQAVPTGKDDLLIVRAEYSDDACAWIPLLSPAKVLYCRNASVLLTPEQNHGLQRFRQALYLYFTGHDEQELSSVMHNPGLVEKKARLAFFGGVVPFNEDEKRRGLEQVETDLLPLVQSIQRHDAPAIDFFRRYSRLIVIDEKSTPVFDHQRLGSYFNLQEGRTWGGLSLLIYTAK